MSSYVDDTTCFLTSDSSFAALDVTLHLCQSASGSLLNRSKTHGLWLGPWRAHKDRPLDTSCSSKDIKILGLAYTPTYSDMITYNWKAILDRFRSALSVWKRRDLSIHGRAKVISVFALSKVYYTARILTMPFHYARKFEREIWSFIWDDRQPPIKRSVCIGPVAQSGLNVPHLPSKIQSFQIQWIRSLFMDRTPCKWSLLPVTGYVPQACIALGLQSLPRRTGNHQHGYILISQHSTVILFKYGVNSVGIVFPGSQELKKNQWGTVMGKQHDCR